jgi:LytS/YehU family sensor histidine kinase
MNHTNQMLLEKEKQEKEKLQNELENYKSHLSPELLNKSMEYLIGIGHQNKELADDFIHNLSDFYRFTLKKRRDEIIPLNEELAVTEKLMWIMKIVYERNISWETDFSNEEGYIVPNTLTALMQQCIYATIINSFQPLKLHLSCSENHLILWHASNPRLTHNKTHDDIQRIKQVYALYTDKPIIQETLNNKDYYRIPLLTINK